MVFQKILNWIRHAPVPCVAAIFLTATQPVFAGQPVIKIGHVKGNPQFQHFVDHLWPLARAKGVSRETFSQAFGGLTADPSVIELTRKQSEFIKPIWEYLTSATSAARISRGLQAASTYAATLDDVESRYGVDRSVVLGVWGMETNFGGYTGDKDVIRSLATLAAINYRGTYFRDELIGALLILQQGHISRSAMRGSWAGAMGQTQFMPSSFQKFAIDFDKDGKKNIWTDVPDALASTANYLKLSGWQTGLPWGFEIAIPHSFDYKLHHLAFDEWAQHGIQRVDGQKMPRSGEASLYFPAGADGPAFLVTANYDVIKRYNNSDAYALGVASLGDRLMGGSPIRAAWPTDDPILNIRQRVELQQSLSRLGYDVGEPNGRLGSRTRNAIRDFQEKRGIVPDGYASHRVLQALQGR